MNSLRVIMFLATFPMLFIGNVGFFSCKKMDGRTIIAQHLSTIKIDENTPSQSIELSILKEFSNSKSTIILELSQIEASEQPDGVYELWIGNSKTDLEFVQVLDLYTLQTQKNAVISIPIQDFLLAKSFDKLIFLKIIFVGNSDANQIISKKAGVLKINKVQIFFGD
ncbi:MAG: hypothetical protein V4683_19845 [Bacteroidota bacterium]